jgi:protein TonB
MIAHLRTVAVASALLMTTFAAHAGEPPAGLKSASCTVPNYPVSWQDDNLMGNVRLAVLVGADGSVQDAKVVKSSGHRLLDRASLRAGYTCKFGASSKNGDSTSFWTTVQYKWVVN